MRFRTRHPVAPRGADADSRELRGGRPQSRSALAVGAAVFGAVALGAVAIGAVALGAVAIGRMAIRRARIHRLEIDELVVRRLRITEELDTPPKGDAGASVAMVLDDDADQTR